MANFTPITRALAELLRTNRGKPSDEDAELAEGQRTDNSLSDGTWFTAKERGIEPWPLVFYAMPYTF